MRLADPRPAACSVCLQPPGIRDPQPEFVDFEVAYDGPVMTRHGERAETVVKTPIDDLFICEDCLKSAARLVGMVDDEQLKGQVALDAGVIQGLKDEIKEKDKAIHDLNHTVSHLIDSGAIKRKAGRPQLRGPETHTKEIKELRSEQAQKEGRGKKKVAA